MYKKFLICFVAFFIFLSSVVNPVKASADVDGVFLQNFTKYIKAIGEKIDVIFEEDSLLHTVNSVIEDAENQINYAAELIDDFVIKVSTPHPIQPNWSNYLLTPDDFKNGIKAIESASKKSVGTKYPQGMLCRPDMRQFGEYANKSGVIRFNTHSGSAIIQYVLMFDAYSSARFIDLYGGFRLSGLEGFVNAQWIFDREWLITPSKNTSYQNSATESVWHEIVYSSVKIEGLTSEQTYIPRDLCSWTSTSKVSLSPLAMHALGNLNKINKPVEITVDDDAYYTDVTPINDPIDMDDFEPVEPEEPDDKPAGSSWWRWLIDFLLKPIELIGNVLKDLLDLVTGLIDALIDALKFLFVPSDGYFDSYFDDTKDIFNFKIPIIGQLGDFFESIKSASVDGEIPEFKVSIPEDWGGGIFNIVDFSYFTDYRVWILNFIRFTMWFVFLKRLYARLPRVLY